MLTLTAFNARSGFAKDASAPRSEYCYDWTTELVTAAQHCVSSVLGPQQNNNYGPINLFLERGAWCEGTSRSGIGEWIIIRFNPSLFFQTIYVINGYTKSAETFRNNSRVKQFRIDTSDGVVTYANLEDHPYEQVIHLPQKEKGSWIRFTITDIYRGEKYSDTCLSKLLVDIEEFQR